MTELPPEKIGAGLLFVCQSAEGGEPKCLLLKRSPTSNNPEKMGLPGGNADPEDNGDLLTTALREATEEMGPPPSFSLLKTFLTKRGKRSQKHFTVFLAKVSSETASKWRPVLNEEHTEYEWVPLSALESRQDLHPVINKLLEAPHRNELFASVQGDQQG